MHEPLRWDTPGLTWDSGATWDGVVSTPKRRKSMNTKAVINFRPYREGDLDAIATYIHEKLTLNAASFPTLPVTMAELNTLILNYRAARTAKASGSKEDKVAFDVARAELEDALGKLGNDVNSEADGDPTLVEKSGFPSYETGSVADTTPPAPPADLILKHTNVNGSVAARYKPDRSPSTNELQINTVNPTVETDWRTYGIFTGGKATLNGLTLGTQIWVRVRTVGINGVMGGWSDPASIWVA